MIGDDPYTLGLFDTAGVFPSLDCTFSAAFLIPLRHVNRPRRLRSLASTFVSANRRLPGLLQRHLPRFVREREGEMVP